MSTVDFGRILPLFGDWKNVSGSNVVKFSSDGTVDASHGLALLSTVIDDGVLECDIQLPNANTAAGAFVNF
jgi:hypothetical protein